MNIKVLSAALTIGLAGPAMAQSSMTNALDAQTSTASCPQATVTPGVCDYVTSIRAGHGYPGCLQFQTANGGGDVANHQWSSTATNFGMSVSGFVFDPVTQTTIAPSGASMGNATQFPPRYSLSPTGAAEALSTLKNSRWAGGPAANGAGGLFIFFADVSSSVTYTDCPIGSHAVGNITE